MKKFIFFIVVLVAVLVAGGNYVQAKQSSIKPVVEQHDKQLDDLTALVEKSLSKKGGSGKDVHAQQTGNRALAWAVRMSVVDKDGKYPNIEGVEKMLSSIINRDMRPKTFEDGLAKAIKQRGWTLIERPATPASAMPTSTIQPQQETKAALSVNLSGYLKGEDAKKLFVTKEDLAATGLIVKDKDGNWISKQVVTQEDLKAAGIMSDDGQVLRKPAFEDQLTASGILVNESGGKQVVRKPVVQDDLVALGLIEIGSEGEIIAVKSAKEDDLIVSGVLAKDETGELIPQKVALAKDLEEVSDTAETALSTAKVNSQGIASHLTKEDRSQFYKYCLKLANSGISFSQVGISREDIEKKGCLLNRGGQSLKDIKQDLLKGFCEINHKLKSTDAEKMAEKLLVGLKDKS